MMIYLRHRFAVILLSLLSLFTALLAGAFAQPAAAQRSPALPTDGAAGNGDMVHSTISRGAFHTGAYRNLFADRGYSSAAISAKVNAAWNQ